jgi:hypothetical protein
MGRVRKTPDDSVNREEVKANSEHRFVRRIGSNVACRVRVSDTLSMAGFEETRGNKSVYAMYGGRTKLHVINPLPNVATETDR